MLGVDGNASGPPFPLQRTRDGGATWEGAGSAPVAGVISARTPKEVWLARSDFRRPQQLYLTRDGGRTWGRRVLPPPRTWSGARLFPDVPTFFGARGVLPVTVNRGKRAAVAFYVTGDGGRTWRLGSVRPVDSSITDSRSPFVRYVPTSIVSPNVWWIAEGRTHPFVTVTTNAGKSWRVSVPSHPLHAAPGEISATDAQHGWLTTWSPNNRVLYTTSDGGETWSRLSLPPT